MAEQHVLLETFGGFNCFLWYVLGSLQYANSWQEIDEKWMLNHAIDVVYPKNNLLIFAFKILHVTARTLERFSAREMISPLHPAHQHL